MQIKQFITITITILYNCHKLSQDNGEVLHYDLQVSNAELKSNSTSIKKKYYRVILLVICVKQDVIVYLKEGHLRAMAC